MKIPLLKAIKETCSRAASCSSESHLQLQGCIKMHVAEDCCVVILTGSMCKPILNDFLELVFCIKQHLHAIKASKTAERNAIQSM